MELGVILCTVVLTAGLWLKYVHNLDRVEPEPIRMLVWVGLAGGLLSSIPAGTLNGIVISFSSLSLDETLPLGQAVGLALFVGFNEELCKLLATILLMRKSRHFNEPADGIVYSTMVALGFAAFENLEYGITGGAGILLVRGVTALPLHLGLAALWGYGLTRWKFLQEGSRVVIVWYFLAAVIHATYDAVLFALPPEHGVVSLGLALVSSWTLIKIMNARLKSLIVQSPFIRAGYCPHCNKLNGYTDEVCSSCGASLAQEFSNPCSGCGVKLSFGMKFCPRCGRKML